MKKKIRVWFDLDGVIANFDEYYKILFGEYPLRGDKNRWKKIFDADPKFFYNLPLIESAAQLYKYCKYDLGFDTFILSSANPNFIDGSSQKFKFVIDKLDEDAKIFIVNNAILKQEVIGDPEIYLDILIDDLMLNCKQWFERGGEYIYFDRNIDNFQDIRDFLNLKKDMYG